MSYSVCIFDLDGTLLDTLPDLTIAVNFSMKQMGYPERTVDEIRSFVGNGIRMLVKRAVPANIADSDFEKAFGFFAEYYFKHLTDFTKPYYGMAELAEKLKNDGKKIAVVSNKEDDAAHNVVQHYFGDLFEVVVGKRDDIPSKPAPDSVYYVTEKLNAEKSDCIYIGDSEVDVQTAHNAGLPCIGVTWGNRDKSVLLANGADYIADKPEEIVTVIYGG